MDKLQKGSADNQPSGSKSITTNKLIRPDLRPYYECLPTGKLICKLCTKPSELTYNSVRGWSNFIRHLVSVFNVIENWLLWIKFYKNGFKL